MEDLVDIYVKDSLHIEPKKGVQFSKFLCICIMIITAFTVIITTILMFYLEDLSPLTYLIPAVFTEASVISGFYSYKAKAENQIKLEIRKMIIQQTLNMNKTEMLDISEDLEED